MKKKSRGTKRLCTISYSRRPWGKLGQVGSSFKWGVLVLFGEKTHRDFLHPLQKIDPVSTELPEIRERNKRITGHPRLGTLGFLQEFFFSFAFFGIGS